MVTVAPLKGLTPPPARAARVASVPYDVVDRSEAAALAHGNTDSFLHVTKPEIDLPADTALPEVYAEGARALRRLRQSGALVEDEAPVYYVYALTMGEHRQVGVVLRASVRDYNEGRIKKHEFTRPDKEDDRVHHMQAVGAQTGKVFVLYRDAPALAELLGSITERQPEMDFTAADGVQHTLWRVGEAREIAQITRAFAGMPALYIADGHHRAAAASRVAAAQDQGADGPLLAVAFAQSACQILPYNRVVRDLNGQTPEAFLAAVRARFTVTDGKPQTVQPCQCAMYLAGRWYTLRWPAVHDADPVAALDVSVLQERLLAPVLGIRDPRRDKRVDFVGGIRGDGELEKRVKGGWAVAFSMSATRVEELLAVADAGRVMPPKSTWFEPKLRDGLVVLPL